MAELIPLLRKYSNLRLLLIGDGDEVDIIEQYIEDNNMENQVVLLGRIPYFDIKNYLSASDIGLSLIRPADFHIVASPCKLFEYLGMGLPVIANREIPEHMRVLNTCKGGVLVSWGSAEELRRSVEYLLLNPKTRKRMGVLGFKYVTKERSFKIYSHRISHLINMLKTT